MPDNRELATLFWLTVALCWVLSKPELRSGLGGIFRTLFQHPFVYLSLTAMAGYMALEVWAGARLHLWNRHLLNPTILWAVLSGGVMFFESNKVARDPQFFRTMLAETVAVGVFIEFFMNVFVMSLPAEIVTQFIIAALALMRGVAGHKPEHRQARKVFDVLFALIGFAFVAYTARRTYTEWATLDAREMTLQFILPVWLTIGVLPFIYALSLIITYDSTLRGINWAAKNARPRPRWRAWFALVTGLHFRHRDVNAFNRSWTKRLVEASSIRQAHAVMRNFRDERRAALQAIADAEEGVRRYAGSDATDEADRRLDRREFQETMDALRWLQMAQSNMHLNHGGRYRDDLLRMIGDDFRGLPDEAGVVLEVADDGQSWYAWRRTITGWCFATGAAGPPPDLWEFDGPEPPRDFPGHDPIWGERPFAEDRNRNWQQPELEQTV